MEGIFAILLATVVLFTRVASGIAIEESVYGSHPVGSHAIAPVDHSQ